MRKIKFVKGYFYHIFNRGVEKRQIFMGKQDYYRFIHDLYEFNDANAVINLSYRYGEYRGSTSIIQRTKKILIKIICFCLMPNHFHLILRQVRENGISKFMQKLGTGYTMYFNQKYKRTGTLFGGRFKSVFIETDEQLLHLSRYIHINPLTLIQPHWEETGISNWTSANKFLEDYKWSSYLDYIGKHNFPSLVNRKPILEHFNNENAYMKFVNEYVLENRTKIQDLIIEVQPQ